MNALYTLNKPIFISSNRFLGQIKRYLGVKKAGFSGTLDPFATGCLIVATGQYTKLLPFLRKTPKTYRATLWLGAYSPSYDVENITHIETIAPLKESKKRLDTAIVSLVGTQRYTPPLFSAKKIKGKRAYDLARKGEELSLSTVTSTIYQARLLHYNHPFVTFEVTVSEGTYVRSLGQIVAKNLGVQAVLSALHRVSEGDFQAHHLRAYNPFHHLRIPSNTFKGDPKALELGKKLSLSDFHIQAPGTYLIETPSFYSIIEIFDTNVRYKLNRIAKNGGVHV